MNLKSTKNARLILALCLLLLGGLAPTLTAQDAAPAEAAEKISVLTGTMWENDPEMEALIEGSQKILTDDTFAALGIELPAEIPALPDFRSVQTQGIPQGCLRKSCDRIVQNTNRLTDQLIQNKNRYLAHLLRLAACIQLTNTLNEFSGDCPWRAEKLAEIRNTQTLLQNANGKIFEQMIFQFEKEDTDLNPDSLFLGCSLFLKSLMMTDFPAETLDGYLSQMKEIAGILDSMSGGEEYTGMWKVLDIARQELRPVKKLPVLTFDRNPTDQELQALAARQDLFVLCLDGRNVNFNGSRT